MGRSYAATRLASVSSDSVQMLLPAMRAHRRFFSSDQPVSPCFMLHAQAGQWRRNPAGRTRDGSRGPPFPASACLPVRGAGCVPPFRAGSVTGVCPSLFLPFLLSSLARRLPIGCSGGEFPLQSITWMAYPALFHRLATRICGYPGKAGMIPGPACVLSLQIKSFGINDLSGLSRPFPQACYQKMWISPRSASLGAALRRTARPAHKVHDFASEREFPL